MNMTTKSFTLKFKTIFNVSPYQWMLEGKTQDIHNEITKTDKPFKQIAAENGFAALSQFSRFCKKHLRQNPSKIRQRSWICTRLLNKRLILLTFILWVKYIFVDEDKGIIEFLDLPEINRNLFKGRVYNLWDIQGY